MTRKERVIEAMEHIFENTKRIHGNSEAIDWQKLAIHKSVDYILALPLDVPSEEEMQEWVNKDKKSLIDYEVYTMSELKERLIGRFEGAKWAINEIIERNK